MDMEGMFITGREQNCRILLVLIIASIEPVWYHVTGFGDIVVVVIPRF